MPDAYFIDESTILCEPSAIASFVRARVFLSHPSTLIFDSSVVAKLDRTDYQGLRERRGSPPSFPHLNCSSGSQRLEPLEMLLRSETVEKSGQIKQTDVSRASPGFRWRNILHPINSSLKLQAPLIRRQLQFAHDCGLSVAQNGEFIAEPPVMESPGMPPWSRTKRTYSITFLERGF